jgi:pteridine reductase
MVIHRDGMDGLPLALITGAAHRLGKNFAMTLAKRGYAILLHYHQAAGKAAIAAKEFRSLGVPVYLVQADLMENTGVSSLLSILEEIPNKLKVLVNSASVMQRTDIQSTSSEEWDATFAVNLRAPFLLTQQAVKWMRGDGLIINITDEGVNKLWKGYPAYVVSKIALETLTRLQAKTYAPGIRVNAISPGFVLPSDNITKDEWESLVERLPLKHPTSLLDIAKTLDFLIDNPSITGQTIIVDGGYSLI